MGNGHRAPLDPSLAATECEVIEAADGDEGLRKHQGGGINLVIIDILMPEKKGLETIRDLRQANSAVNIIAISCGDRGGNLSYLGMAAALGADRVLTKPIRRFDLLAKIDAVPKD